MNPDSASPAPLTAGATQDPATDHRRLDWVVAVVTLLACAVLVVLGLGRSLIGDTVFASTDVLYRVAPWSSHVEPGFEPQNRYVGDPVDANLPGQAEFADRLRDGDFAQWSSLQSGGHELGATPSLGLLSPTTVASFALPLPLAPGYQKLLDLTVAIGGMFLFARRLGLGRAAGLIGGLAFATSGFLVVWTNWPQARVAALIPAVFWAIERLLQARSGRNVAVLALVIAAMVLAGFPSVVAYTLITAAPYVLARLVAADRHRPARMLGGVALIGAGVGLGVLLSAVQLLPFVRQLGASFLGDRTQQGDFESLGSLVTMIMPDAYGTAADGWNGPRNPIESISYAGVTVVLLAVIGAVVGLRQRRGRWVIVALVGSAAFWGVAMYVGGPFLLALQELPVFATNRIGRARSVLGFVVAVLAAIGVDALIAGRRRSAEASAGRRRLPIWLGAGVAAVAVAGLVAHGAAVARDQGVEDGVYSRSVLLAGVFLAAAATAVALARHGRGRWRVTGLLALPVLVLAQALMFVLPFWPQVPREQFYPQTPTHEYLADSLGHDRFVSTKGVMMPGTNLVYGLRALNGHAFMRTEFADLLDAVDPDGFGAATLFAPDLPDVVAAGPLLDRLGVRFVVAPPTAEVPGRRTVVGPAGEAFTLQPGVTAASEIPAGPLRGIGVSLREIGPTQPVQLDVRVLDREGALLLAGSREISTGESGDDVMVALAGEDLALDPAGALTVELTMRGDQAVVVAGTADGSGPRLALAQPADDGLRLIRTGEASIYERLDALPRIRWAGTAAVEPDRAAAIAMLTDPDPAADVVLTEPGPTDVDSTASVEVLEDSGDTIRVAVDAQGPGYVVVADAVADSFSASVDGESAELRAADHGYVAVAVPAGGHEVRLDYRQPYAGAGILVSSAAALATIALVSLRPARDGRRRWSAQHTSPR